MRNMLLVAAATAVGAATLAFAPAAEARQGCGPNYSRAPNGRCVPNRNAHRAQQRPVLVVGNFYQGRGYWDGRRYYQQRYRYRNGWRYR